MQTFFTLTIIQMFFETIGKILFFPFWWYGRGLFLVLRWAGLTIHNQYINLQLGVWLKNLFVPMYGTTDILGRIISFGVRFFMVVVRGVALLAWIFLLGIMTVVYVLLLPVTAIGLIFNFFVFFP